MADERLSEVSGLGLYASFHVPWWEVVTTRPCRRRDSGILHNIRSATLDPACSAGLRGAFVTPGRFAVMPDYSLAPDLGLYSPGMVIGIYSLSLPAAMAFFLIWWT
jgi:hypothetical protein